VAGIGFAGAAVCCCRDLGCCDGGRDGRGGHDGVVVADEWSCRRGVIDDND
jgi:hypothetical protein